MQRRSWTCRGWRVALVVVAALGPAALHTVGAGAPGELAAAQALTPPVDARAVADVRECPGTPRIACYPMDSPTGAAQYDFVDTVNPAVNTVRGALDPATSAGVVAARNASTYYVSGWGAFVRKAGSRWKLAPDPVKGSGAIGETYGQVLVDRTGVDAPATSFNPGLRDWRVRLRLEPELLRFGSGDFQLPDACSGAGCGELTHPSYNVVQKGRNVPGGPIGGFYKIELMGYTGSDHGLGFTKGSVHCVFTDDDGTSVEAFTGGGASPVLLSTRSYYTIECLRAGSSVTLKVSDDTTGAQEVAPGTMTDSGHGPAPASGDGVLDTVAPANIAGSLDSPLLAVGKKPMSTNPADAFRGWLDYVSLDDR